MLFRLGGQTTENGAGDAECLGRWSCVIESKVTGCGDEGFSGLIRTFRMRGALIRTEFWYVVV